MKSNKLCKKSSIYCSWKLCNPPQPLCNRLRRACENSPCPSPKSQNTMDRWKSQTIVSNHCLYPLLLLSSTGTTSSGIYWRNWSKSIKTRSAKSHAHHWVNRSCPNHGSTRQHFETCVQPVDCRLDQETSLGCNSSPSSCQNSFLPPRKNMF